MKLFLVLMLLSFSAWGLDSSKCSGMMNKGYFKTYKWQGVGESNTKAITAESKSSNTISAVSKISTESSTASVDTKYSSNVSTSQSQSMSSWGDCSLFALQERAEQRDLYVAQNLDQVKAEIASGQGRHLETLSWFSLCEDSAQPAFAQAMQKNMAAFLVSDAKAFNKSVDAVIQGDRELSNKCYLLTAN